jgi:acetyl-CoA carboxylase biotin carboxyl carrier protein
LTNLTGSDLVKDMALFTAFTLAYNRKSKQPRVSTDGAGLGHTGTGSRTNMKSTKHDSDVAFITALAELLRDNDLTELHVKRDYGEDDSLNVRVSRAAPAPIMAAAPIAMAAPALAAPAATIAAAPVGTVDDPASHPGAVTSPMVGTVYLQAEPESPSFITVGASITEGDTLLIIEAMKTMNHIPAPKSGTINRILVDDGATVEFGTPLVIIE